MLYKTGLYLAGLMLLCACAPVKNGEGAAANKTENRAGSQLPERYVVGTLGERKLKMSSYQVQDVSYADTPTPFSAARLEYKPGQRTYDSELSSFGFYLNYEKGEPRDVRNDAGFYDEIKVSGTPWILVGVGDSKDLLNKDRFDQWLAQKVSQSDLPEEQYVRLPEDHHGLEEYRVFGIHPETGIPYRLQLGRFPGMEADDLFIARDQTGHVRSYITCHTHTDVPNPPCSHKFVYRENGLDLTFSMSYSRHRLYDWRAIEEQAVKVIWSFVEAAEADIKQGIMRPEGTQDI